MKIIRAISPALFILLVAATFASAQANGPLSYRQLGELTASDGRAQDLFGYSIALDRDTLVVGAPQSVGSAGKAYVFVKPASGWGNMTQTAELTPSDGVPGFFFGWKVAISADTIVVDAGSTDGTGLQAVYVFVKPSGGWSNMTETAKLTLPNGNFLYTVAVSGNTIAAGATEETVGSNLYQGAVYIFERPNSGWRSGLAPRARLIASDGRSGDYLGIALSSFGNAVVATAIDHAAYVFLRPKGGWVSATQSGEFTGSSGSDEFGYSVAVNGGMVAVGAPEAGGQDYLGAAFVFGNHGGEIMASNPGNYNFFGASVAVSGNLTIVGANGVAVGGNQYEGAAYVFEDGVQVAELTPTPGIANEEMGWSVAASGSTIAAGAVYATVGFNALQGEVYVFGLLP